MASKEVTLRLNFNYCSGRISTLETEESGTGGSGVLNQERFQAENQNELIDFAIKELEKLKQPENNNVARP